MNLETLAGHPFAQGLTEAQLQKLAGCAQERALAPGTLILREGSEADAVFLLVTGRVALEQHVPGKGTVQVESLRAGDLLGLSWLFPSSRWMLDARAVEPTTVIVLDAACLRRVMDEEPGLGCAVLSHLVQRLYERLVRVRLQRLDVYRMEA